MLLVVEGGSTKADWLLANGKNIIDKYSTVGFNPYFHNADFIVSTLNSHEELKKIAYEITELHFFGAGCSSKERNSIVESGLKKFFPRAAITVDHDLMASAYATCGNSEGIACIIGTGSNSCYFDGVKVHDSNYGLGYILGDEGSGSYYGKKLLTTYLYNLMPEDIHKSFFESYKLDKNTIIKHVYSMPDANVWLASFAKFLTEFKEHPYIRSMIVQGMRDFIELYVIHYPNYKRLPIHFVGSLAYLFAEELKEVAAEYKLITGKIIKQPIDELMEYFLSKE